MLGSLFGVLGAHRFYCNKPFTAVLMLFSGGGLLIWWAWDLFHLRDLVSSCNTREEQRRSQGLPPSDLAFLPPRDQLDLRSPPKWAKHRSSRGRIIGSAAFLFVIGISMGAVCGSTGAYEPMLILALFIVASLAAARWKSAANIPPLDSLIRWVHRLRLYYHTVDPGNLWLLTLRPIFGLMAAPWRPKARAEVRLYLQFGALLAAIFVVFDAAELLQSGGFWSGFGILVSEFVQTVVYTYLFVAPAGALLTTQLLLARRDFVVWILSAITLASIYIGVTMF